MNNLSTLYSLLIQVVIIAGCHSSILQRLHPNSQLPSEVSRQHRPEWRPAIYRGLTMGKSTRADMLSVFGKPKWSELFDKDKLNPEVWYHYDGGGELQGELVVNLDKHKDTILRMLLHLKNLSKEEVIQHFGNNYVVTRYEFCKGFEEADSAPIYETPDGQIQFIEYRERGIAVAVNDDDRVNYVTYVSEAIGVSPSKCERQNK